MQKIVPLGVKLLSYSYLLSSCLYALSVVLFYNRILVFGHVAERPWSWLLRLVLIVVPIYLCVQLLRLKKDGLIVAVCYHSFFFVNNLITFSENEGFMHAPIHIAGFYGSIALTTKQLLILLLSSLVHVVLICYLHKRRGYFYLHD